MSFGSTPSPLMNSCKRLSFVLMPCHGVQGVGVYLGTQMCLGGQLQVNTCLSHPRMSGLTCGRVS